MTCRVASLVLALLLCSGTVSLAQEDPWPPLVTTCSVMPLLAADADKNAHDLMACASTSDTNCETINCQVLSNLDQVELELLPCWQYPAMWIKIKTIKGLETFQDIFAGSRIAHANVGGSDVQLNVTVVQRDGLTLGFGLSVIFSDSTTRTIFSYMDIPLNLTECPGGITPEYPLLCTMILYMEQYIISSLSAMQHDPSLTPMCDRPLGSCDTMHCYWTDAMGTKISHTYNFLHCSNPQSVRFILTAGENVYNLTFTDSKMVTLNESVTLNFTLKHPSDSTVGLAVVFIVNGQNNVILPYTVLPMNRNGCTKEKLKIEDAKENFQIEEDVKGKQTENKMQLVDNIFTRIDSPLLHSTSAPLISTCDITPLLAMSLNAVAIPQRILNCSIAPPPNCTHVRCAVIGTTDTIALRVEPCSIPNPSFHLTVKNGSDSVLFDKSINKSMQVDVQLSQGPIPVHFTVIKHYNKLTLGISIEAELDGNTTTTLVPYIEIPLNVSTCPWATALTPTCAVMQNLAQLLTYSLTNITQDTDDVWNCFINKPCLRLNCTFGKTLYYLVAVSPCDKSLVLTKGYTNGTVIFHSRVTSSGMYTVNNFEFLSVQLQYFPDTFELGFQVSVVNRDINNSSMSHISPFIPNVYLPLNLTECADNRTSSAQGTYLIDTCEVMPQLSSMATSASSGMLSCMSLPRPYCNKMVCAVGTSGDVLSVEMLPCYRGNDTVSIMNIARDGKVTLREIISDSVNYSRSAVIGGFLGYFTITVVNHPQRLTTGLAISANLTFGKGYHMFDLIPYNEIPLDTTYCEPPSDTPTCNTMDKIAQYLNVYIKNDTHRNDGYCLATRASYCNSIVCKDSKGGGSFNMTFLPCGDRIGYHTVDGNATKHGYDFTIFSSSTLNYTDHIHGNITLEQINRTAVNFEVKLLVDDVYVGSEVPNVTIQLDKQICNASNPQTDPYALISTCDIMPVLASGATAAAPSLLQCHSSYSRCNAVSCLILPTNDTMTIELHPCLSPPSIRLTNTDSRGNLLFNSTYGHSASDIPVNLGGNMAVFNISVVQHHGVRTLGLKIMASFGMASASIIPLVPYYEIPLDLTTCILAPPNETETCGVMDGVAQYMTVIFANSTHSQGRLPNECFADHGPDSLCNTIVCSLLDGQLSVIMAFSPCDNPVGLNFTYLSNISGSYYSMQRFITQFFSTFFDFSKYLQITLFPRRRDNVVYFKMELTNEENEVNVTLLEVPFVAIPLDTGMCTNNTIPDGHQNHTHPNNTHNDNNSTSFADICNFLPQVAQQVSKSQGALSLDCVSPAQDCNALQCYITMGPGQQQRFSIWVKPCAVTPQLEVWVPSRNSGSRDFVYLTVSRKIDAIINNSTFPIYFNINQHGSKLTMGLEVLLKVNATSNVTLIPYKEIPLDRSTCQTEELSSACSALSNISQYMNVALGNFSAQPVDCTFLDSCDAINCIVGYSGSMLSFILQPCDVPPSIKGDAKLADGTILFNRTIENNQIIPWMQLFGSNYLNVTLLHYNSSVIGLEMNLVQLRRRTAIVEVIPSTVIPLEDVDCTTSITPPIITGNVTFTSTCDIMPWVAASAVPLGTSDMACSSSTDSGCGNITCTVLSNRDSIVIELHPCFYPPAVYVYNYVNGQLVKHHTFSQTMPLTLTFGGQKTFFTFEMYQHTDYLSLGLQVFATISGHLITFIPYREIPMNRSGCPSAPVSPTCHVMSHISQYITVFMGNASNSPYETPDCFVDRATFCDRITCQIRKTNQAFNFTINPCAIGRVLFEIEFDDGQGAIYSDPKSASSKFRFLNEHDSSLIFNNLDNGDTVQVKVTVNSGPFAGILIPMVTIPVDKGYCSKHGGLGTTTGTSASMATTSSSTAQSKANTNIIIAVTVGAGGIFLLVIIVLCGLMFVLACKGKKSSDEPYAYSPLSNAEDAEDRLEYSVERSTNEDD